MKNFLEETDVYVNEYLLLAEAKGIANDHSLSKDELLKENAAFIKAYEALLKKCDKPTRNDAQPVQPEEIVAMKSRLLSHITHEFLTPLNLIMTPLEHMLTKSSSQEEKKTLAMMHRNSQRLLLIIGQILELLKLESRKLSLKASPQDLIPFLKGIIASFELLAEQKEVALIFDTDNENIPLYFESEKIAEVICNLMMNALKFTPPGGQIRVSVRQLSANLVEISEHNTGAEISLDQTTRIFDRFYQLNERFEHYINGLGIGLFLAKEYIKLHQGTIHVNSAPGKGTEFVIRLPKGKAHLKPGEIKEPPVSPEAQEAGCKISERYAFMVEYEREERDGHKLDSIDIPTDEKEMQDRDMVLVVEDNYRYARFYQDPPNRGRFHRVGSGKRQARH